MKICIGHPTANQFFRYMTTALHQSDLLGFAATGLNLGPILEVAGALLPLSLRTELSRRSFREAWAPHLRTRANRELMRLLCQSVGLNRLCQGEASVFGVDAVFQDFDRWIAKNSDGVDAFYLYEDGALNAFEHASRSGLRRIYDLPIAYWETLRFLIQFEQERLPAWSSTLGGGLNDSVAKLDRKVRELELAELVVVPSRFVADSIPTWAKDKRVVISPFGSPIALSPKIQELSLIQRRSRVEAHKPLRVLFAGSMGQRKGLGDLMYAVRELGCSEVELVVMGSLMVESSFYHRACPGFIHEAGRSHSQVLELMRSCDVFCLPSIVEGRALVMQEAMSQGLPIIITPNTGGADLICNLGLEGPVYDENYHLLEIVDSPIKKEGIFYGRGATGFLVPIRTPSAIAEAIKWCSENREALILMGSAAQEKAAQYTWNDYGVKIVSSINNLWG